MNPLIVNVKHAKCDTYVGRRESGMHFGNPWTHLPIPNAIIVGSRDEAIQAYRDWLEGTGHSEVEPERRKWILDNLWFLKGRVLGCFCAPLKCHAEILLELIEKQHVEGLGPKTP